MKVLRDFPLSQIVYYKIGGIADFLLEIETKEDLLQAFDFISENKITKVLPIGLGSNLLINDKPFNGTIIRFVSPSQNEITNENGQISVFASHHLDTVIQFGFTQNLVGLEWAGGLPSLVGAAVRGNVGAFGGEIQNSVAKIEVVEIGDEGYVQKQLEREELQFSYRDSLIKQSKNIIVTNVHFRLREASLAELEEAKKEYYSHIEYRKTHHPMEYPSCGSVFKNITIAKQVQEIIEKWPEVKVLSEIKWHGKISMGYVIDRLGFTGKIRGGAQVSEKHSNYIVNKNNASFLDAYGLMKEIQESFENAFGFMPEPEVEIVL